MVTKGRRYISEYTKTNWEICEGCGECCGIIPFEPKMFAKFVHIAARPFEIRPGKLMDMIYAVTEDGWCVFLDQERRCRIYNDRPDICRLYGTIPELKCTYLNGEKPDRLAEYMSAKRQAEKFLL